jgi:hypothetical protein
MSGAEEHVRVIGHSAEDLVGLMGAACKSLDAGRVP